MQIVKRIIFLFSLFFIYIIGKEFIELYILARSLHPVIGYLTLIAIVSLLIYFIAIPLYRIIKIPKHTGPTTNRHNIQQVLEQRINNFKSNVYLQRIGFDFNTIEYNEEGYKKIIDVIQVESDKIKKKYITRLFYSSSVSHNGFVDAGLILSTSINLIRELFVLYNGRVSNKDLFGIGKKVYYSMAIGGSEGIEYATEEIISSIAIKGINGIPLINKLVSSLTDGFVNAVLLTRIALITENYCKLIYIESEKSLYPSPKFIIDTTKHITSDITVKMKGTLEKIRDGVFEVKDNVIDKTVEYGKYALNPASFVLGKSVDMVTDTTKNVSTSIRDGLTYAASPFVHVLIKSTNLLYKNKTKEKTTNKTKIKSINKVKKKTKVTTINSIYKKIKMKDANPYKYRISANQSTIIDKLKHTARPFRYVFSKSSSVYKKIKGRK